MSPQIRGPSAEYAKIEIVDVYMKAHKTKWTPSTARVFKLRVHHFNRWLKSAKINLREIQTTDLDRYWVYLFKRNVSDSSLTQYKVTIKAFLRWLAVNHHLSRTAVELELDKAIPLWLLEHAREIKKPHPNRVHRIYVGELYDWIEKDRIDLTSFTKKQLKEFEYQLKHSIPPRSAATRRVVMRMIHNHLRWLIARGYINSTRGELGLTKEKHPAFEREISLPPQAIKFLRVITSHKRTSTIRGYRTRLGHFYQYLHRRQLGLDDFTRLNFEEYIASMHRDAYSPQTSRHAIGVVQIYLSWLYEVGFLKKDPEAVIRYFSLLLTISCRIALKKKTMS